MRTPSSSIALQFSATRSEHPPDRPVDHGPVSWRGELVSFLRNLATWLQRQGLHGFAHQRIAIDVALMRRVEDDARLDLLEAELRRLLKPLSSAARHAAARHMVQRVLSMPDRSGRQRLSAVICHLLNDVPNAVAPQEATQLVHLLGRDADTPTQAAVIELGFQVASLSGCAEAVEIYCTMLDTPATDALLRIRTKNRIDVGAAQRARRLVPSAMHPQPLSRKLFNRLYIAWTHADPAVSTGYGGAVAEWGAAPLALARLACLPAKSSVTFDQRQHALACFSMAYDEIHSGSPAAWRQEQLALALQHLAFNLDTLMTVGGEALQAQAIRELRPDRLAQLAAPNHGRCGGPIRPPVPLLCALVKILGSHRQVAPSSKAALAALTAEVREILFTLIHERRLTRDQLHAMASDIVRALQQPDILDDIDRTELRSLARTINGALARLANH